jgi:hypothetical protein
MTPSFLIIVFQLAINNKATCGVISQWSHLLRLESSYSPLRKLLLKATVNLNPRRSPLLRQYVHFQHTVQVSCFQLINFLWRLIIVYILCIVFIIFSNPSTIYLSMLLNNIYHPWIYDSFCEYDDNKTTKIMYSGYLIENHTTYLGFVRPSLKFWICSRVHSILYNPSLRLAFLFPPTSLLYPLVHFHIYLLWGYQSIKYCCSPEGISRTWIDSF